MSGGCHYHDYDRQWRTHECSGTLRLWCDQCLGNCSPGEFIKGGECVKCAPNCLRCSGSSPEDCIVCQAGFAFDFRAICVSRCQDVDQYGTQGDGCKQCDTQCRSCLNAFDNSCVSCASTAYLKTFFFTNSTTETGYCLPIPQGQFTIGYFRRLPSDSVVFACPSNCATCRDRYFCTSCNTGFYLHPPVALRNQWRLCVNY